MTTRTKTVVRWQEGETGTGDEWERRASSCHRSLGTRVKGPSSGAFHSPSAGIRQAVYPPRRIRRRNVDEKDPWRGSRHDSLPNSPSMASRNEVWKTEGVSTFSLSVLVRVMVSTYVFIVTKKRVAYDLTQLRIVWYSTRTPRYIFSEYKYSEKIARLRIVR